MAVYKTTETRDERGRLLALERDVDLFDKAHPVPLARRLPIAEMRRIALAFIGKERPDFEKRRADLHPFEGNKDRELYLFRWEDYQESKPDDEDFNAPFVQVGTYADGTIASYSDTLKA